MRDSSADALNQDQFNFFGVIIDAGYPYKTQQGRFICTIKVVDQTLHHSGGTDTVTPVFAQVIIYAKRQEDLPVVSNIGDIIRIHRANMKEFQGHKQFNVNVFYNSSWCLFRTRYDPENEDLGLMDSDQENNDEGQQHKDDPETMHDEEKATDREEKRKYRPYKFSGKSYTFDINHERVLVDEMRKWACMYFEREYVITKDMYKLLKDLKASSGSAIDGGSSATSEFDLLVKILKVFEKDDNTLELRIKDISQKMWYMSIPRLKFHPSVLRQGEIVRVRCVELNLTTKRDVIQVKPYTNILRLHPESRLHQELCRAIEDETDTDKLLLDDANEVLMSPVIYTEITNPNFSNSTKTPTFKLTDLFINHEQLPEDLRERNIFKVRFYCLRIDP